jgi:hypothetical protein
MKIGGKILFGQKFWGTTGPMTLYVGLYQEEPGMTNQPTTHPKLLR